MKLFAALAALPLLALVACGDARPEPTRAEKIEANQTAGGEAEKSFDKEVPADPAAFQAAPK